MYQLWITSFFFRFFLTSHPPNRCLSVIVMSSSYPSKWFDYKWVTKVAIEPLHSSKLLMCAQIVQCVGVWKKKRAGEKGNEGRKREGEREGKEMSRLLCFAWRIKREGKLSTGSVWSFGYPATSQFHPTRADVYITWKDWQMKNTVICIVFTVWSLERLLINILRDCKNLPI